MLGKVKRRLPGWHIGKRGETGKSWVRKKEQKDVSCSIPLGSDSGVALLPFIQGGDSHLSLSLLSSEAQLAECPQKLWCLLCQVAAG